MAASDIRIQIRRETATAVQRLVRCLVQVMKPPELKHRNDRKESDIVSASIGDRHFTARLVQLFDDEVPRWVSCDMDGSNEFLLHGVVSSWTRL